MATPIGSGLTLTSSPIAGSILTRIAAFERDDFARRLWSKDTTLWGSDPGRVAVAARRLGWLDAPERMRAEVDDLRAFASEVAADGITHAVLLGMGGSSLAPEVMRRVFGLGPGGLELTMLDNTSPAAVRAVTESHDPARTLFLVSSKSGGTIEVASFEKHFFALAANALGGRAGRHFVAITDPGTVLADLARRRGYRRVFENDPDIGGRYSALSYFGLVPAALIGADLERILDSARAEAARSRRSGADNPALVLGAALGELALAGRDKATFVLGPPFGPFGAWVEQLVAESTGKEGRGIVPVVDEALGAPSDYGDDRVFIAFGPGPLPPDTTARLDALEAAGHPVFRWTDDDRGAMGGEFLGWEVVTAVASAVINVNPFDEPNVTEAKQATSAVLAAHAVAGRFDEVPPVASAGGWSVHCPPGVVERHGAADAADPAAWVRLLLRATQPGDYFALLAYVHRTDARHEKLDALRLAARAATGCATTLGYGPRFLHSTGQLHKGGPNRGVFLQITADEGDEPIPGEAHGFGPLRRAQAIGDYQVLAHRGRRVIRVHLGHAIDRGLDAVIEAVRSPV